MVLDFKIISWSPVFLNLLFFFITYSFGEPATQSAGPCDPVMGRDPYFEEPCSTVLNFSKSPYGFPKLFVHFLRSHYFSCHVFIYSLDAYQINFNSKYCLCEYRKNEYVFVEKKKKKKKKKKKIFSVGKLFLFNIEILHHSQSRFYIIILGFIF